MNERKHLKKRYFYLLDNQDIKIIYKMNEIVNFDNNFNEKGGPSLKQTYLC